MSRIFLSHSSKDNFAAIALVDWLKSEGWDDVFLDLSIQDGILAGERWERKLHEASHRCEAVIFLISSHWLDSGWCRKEYALARGLNKKLFGALFEPGKAVNDLPPEFTGTWQMVDLTSRQDMQVFRASHPDTHEEQHVGFSRQGLQRLKRGLEKAGLDAKFFAWPPPGEPNRAPYHGLRSLEAADAGIFFGRDAEIIEFSDALRGLRAGTPPRLLALLGASGAGKSSFLRAGLLPRLERDDSNFLPLSPIRPERAALTGETGFLPALESAFPDQARADLRSAIKRGAAGVRLLLARLSDEAFQRTLGDSEGNKPPTIVICVDQAEELFRPEGAEEGALLLELIRDLTLVDDPAVSVIFAIRSDSYDQLQNAKALETLPQKPLSLAPMPRNCYREVAEGPARRVRQAGGKLTIDPQLTKRLLDDIEVGGGKDALPLLAFTLEQLYCEYGRTGALRLKNYEEFGGLKGAINAAVERAFVRADGNPRIPQDRAAREALLRRGFIPWLAGIDPESKSPRRNIARRSEVPAESLALIDFLKEERLLSEDTVLEKDAQGNEMRVATIEPTHEALLRQWGLLEGWLTEDFGLLATLEGVKRATRDWVANNRAEAWLAHQAQRLAEAQVLDARPDVAARLDATDRAYLARCRAVEDKRIAEAERQRAEAERRRLEREQEQKRRLLDAQKLAAARLSIAVTAGAGCTIALILAIVAGISWFQAKRNADAAVQALSALIETTSRIVRPIAQLDEVDALIRQARSAMDRFSSFSEDPRIAQQRARTLLLLAQIDWERGNIKSMQEETQQAYDLLNTLAAGGDPDFRFLRAGSRHLLGLAYFDENEKDKSLAQYRAAVAELTDLLRLKVGDDVAAQWEQALADVNQDLGDVLLSKFNDPEKALAAYNYCYEERVDLARRHGGGTAAERHDIAWTLNKRADVAVRQGRDDEALDWFIKGRDGIAQLGDELWNNILWPDHLAVIDSNIGLIYRNKGDYARAVDNFKLAEALLKRVILRDPKNLFRKNSLSWTYYIRAEAQFRWAIADHNGDLLRKARANLVVTVADFTDLVNQAPDKIQWQNGRVGAQALLAAVDGFIAQWTGDDVGAAKHLTSAANLLVEKFIPLIDQIPRPDFAADTVEFLDWAGTAEVKIGNLAAGRSDLYTARDMLLKYRSILGEQHFAVLQQRIEADIAQITKIN